MTFRQALESPALKRTWPWIWTSLPVQVLIEYQAVAPIGHEVILMLGAPYLLGLLVATLALISSPLLLIRRSSRTLVLAWLLAGVVYLPLGMGGFVLGLHVRHWGFERLAERSAPLVKAIHAYTEQRGQPPVSLTELVPDYLPRVPRTGMMAYPDYRYHAGTNAHRYENNPWVLVVPTPSGGINFDQFMYFPLQNYPARGYGGSLVRIRDWVYVRE